MIDKKALRKDVRSKIAALDESYINESNGGIYKVLTSMPEFMTAPTIFAYYSVGREVDTLKIIELALELGKNVALPIAMPEGRMEYALIETAEDEFENSNLNIPEPTADAERVSPAAGDLLLVPAVCFDLDGYRLGQGGGYYDRYLAACPAFTLGLGRHNLLMREVPREIHDLPAKCLITERGIIKRYRERKQDGSCGGHNHEDGVCGCGKE